MQLLCNTVVLLLIPTMLAFPLDSEGSEGQLVPDLGISNINDVNIENVGTILDLMIKSGGSVKNVIDKFSNLSNLEIVEELVEESEEIITRLQQGVSEINEKHRSFAGEALKNMIYIKLQLKTSRISLNDLAQRTVYAVADLKAFSEAFFADDTEEISDLANVVDLRNADKIEYVKEQMTVMMNLIKDTNTKITEVRTIYAEIREKMSSVEETLVQYKLMVEHLLKNETSDGANYQVGAILPALQRFVLVNDFKFYILTGVREIRSIHKCRNINDSLHSRRYFGSHGLLLSYQRSGSHRFYHNPGGGPRQHEGELGDSQERRRAGDLRRAGVDGDPGRGGGVPVQRGADSGLLGSGSSSHGEEGGRHGSAVP